MKTIEIVLSGVRLRLDLHFPALVEMFQPFRIGECGSADVWVEPEEAADYPLICPDGVLTPGGEAYILMAHVSRELLKHERVVFHGVAFLWRGRAWLLTAPSGTGKTTQLRHWQRLWGEEIKLISGDKPILEQRADGSVWLHPSPWTGKEGEQGTSSGKLAGIVLLRQATENRIERLSPREAVFPLFEQFLMTGETEAELRAAGRLEDALLRQIPVWRLDNLGDEASARLTRAALEEAIQ